MFEYEQLSRAIIDGEAEKALALTEKGLKEGYPAEKILEKGLIAGMNTIAERFKTEKVLVPEVLLCTRAMHAGLSRLQPYLKKRVTKSKAKIVLGTVSGDLHDIGKNLVKILLITIGLEIIDLGVNISVKDFVHAVRKEKPDFLMMSSLLTTTMPVMKDVIDELENRGLRKNIRIVIGGAPVNDAFAKEIGADYYFEDAFETRKFFDKKLNKKFLR